MSEISKYEAQKKKLDDLCKEHDLTYRFRNKSYPITMTVRPIQGVTEQLSLLADAEQNDYISPDASMVIYRKDGEDVKTKFNGTFTISKALQSKFVNIYSKMCDYWLLYFFREMVNRGLSSGSMPVIDEAEADDSGDEDFEPDESDEGSEDYPASDGSDPDEDLITASTLLVRQENKATVSLLQRRLNLGYSKAARLMDMLEERGVVGPYRGAEPREVLPYDVPED